MQSFGISDSGASRRRQYSTIILLDEIDMLMTRDQAVSDTTLLTDPHDTHMLNCNLLSLFYPLE
jgi:hypothetical protein